MLNKLEIEYKPIDELIPYENNPRINDDAVDKVAESIEQFGFKVPIIVDKNNVIVAGHTRLKAAKKLGLDEVPVIMADDLTEEQIKAFRLADNKVAEFSYWDYEKLEQELNEIVNLDMSQFGFEEMIEELEKEESEESLYTMKVDTPIYEIKGEEPSLDELVDRSKTDELITEINSYDIPKDIKEFLILAAYRHLKFDYSKIAEYYAHADKEIQELMERSALVIIDFNRAIEEGYVKLSKEIEALREEE